MLHTRLRPHCKEFLEKIAKLYELHVFTFGSRLYAHTIAGNRLDYLHLFSLWLHLYRPLVSTRGKCQLRFVLKPERAAKACQNHYVSSRDHF